jgi:uracil DNA glycosylase
MDSTQTTMGTDVNESWRAEAAFEKIIETSHPSPRFAHRGLFESKPFSRANRELDAKDRAGIDWRLNA